MTGELKQNTLQRISCCYLKSCRALDELFVLFELVGLFFIVDSAPGPVHLFFALMGEWSSLQGIKPPESVHEVQAFKYRHSHLGTEASLHHGASAACPWCGRGGIVGADDL